MLAIAEELSLQDIVAGAIIALLWPFLVPAKLLRRVLL
jgi:hypothetical protein